MRSGDGEAGDTARRPVRLTRAAIIDAAIAVLDEHGSEGLTFRRLGRELGVDHTAVLRHFRNKNALVLALADRLIADAVDGISGVGEWRDVLRELAFRLRAAFSAHPHAAVVAASRLARSNAEFRGADLVIGALLRAGMSHADAASYYRVLGDLALAYAALEASLDGVTPDDLRADSDSLAREYRAADPALFPHLAAVAPLLPALEEQDQFALAVELFLDAIEVRIAQRPGPAAG